MLSRYDDDDLPPWAIVLIVIAVVLAILLPFLPIIIGEC